MLSQWIRVIYDSGSALTDNSIDLQSDTPVSTTLSTTGSILIGQFHPFNMMFLGVNKFV